MEKEMAIQSSILVRKIPWTEDPGRLQSMGSQRVTEQNQKQVWIILNTLSIAFPISKDSEHGEAGRRVEILNDL